MIGGTLYDYRIDTYRLPVEHLYRAYVTGAKCMHCIRELRESLMIRQENGWVNEARVSV